MQRLAILVAVFACRKADPGPDLQILGETDVLRAGDTVPMSSPWFDGERVKVAMGRGETIGLLVYHRRPGAVTLAGATGFDVEHAHVTQPSTDMYGGSRGAGDYPDGLTENASPTSDPAYFELSATESETLSLRVDGRSIPVDVAVAPVQLPPLPRSNVWAYEDPRELGNPSDAPNAAEQQCIDLFARHGVLLTPDLSPERWNARKAQFAGVSDVPVIIPEDPALAGDAVKAWLAAMPDQSPFAIPIDEPRTPAAKAKVRALGDAVRAANPDRRFHFAVTAAPDPAFGDRVDLYVSWKAAHLAGDASPRWTYNGAPPYAGSMVVDAAAPGARTWGWIAWRWKIPTWYVWDALYWHDRHNKHSHDIDPITFDDGEDRGNRDGVLALPAPRGCAPTLRLAALRRGFQDKQLLELASACKPTEAAAIAARMMPRALGDAGETASWPSDSRAWEMARRELLALAACK